jgi:proteasome lid subunit RPN8/RPN11
MNSLSSGLYLNADHWAQMEADVKAKAPEEACGIVVGQENCSQLVIPVTNILHSPFRFRMEPEEQLNAFILAEGKSMDILAVYHSHPQGPDQPSATDLLELSFPGIIYLIWYIRVNQWNCRGYLMYPQMDALEVPVIILGEL